MGAISKISSAVKSINSDKEMPIKLAILSLLSSFSAVWAMMHDNLKKTLDMAPSTGVSEAVARSEVLYSGSALLIFLAHIICSLIIIGYFATYINANYRDLNTKLPNFDKMFKFFTTGLKFVPGMIWTSILSFIIMFVFVLLFSASLRVHATDASSAIGSFLFLYICLACLTPSIFLSYAFDLKMSSPFNMNRVFRIIFSIKYFWFVVILLILGAICLYFTHITTQMGIKISPILMFLMLPIESYLLMILANVMADSIPEDLDDDYYSMT